MKLYLMQQDAIREGRREGKFLNLISICRKKLSKGNSPEQISEILEEDLSIIEKITEEIQNNPQMNDEEICERMLEQG